MPVIDKKITILKCCRYCTLIMQVAHHRASVVSSGWKAVARSTPDLTATTTVSRPCISNGSRNRITRKVLAIEHTIAYYISDAYLSLLFGFSQVVVCKSLHSGARLKYCRCAYKYSSEVRGPAGCIMTRNLTNNE